MKHRNWLRGRGKYALFLSAAVMLPVNISAGSRLVVALVPRVSVATELPFHIKDVGRC